LTDYTTKIESLSSALKELKDTKTIDPSTLTKLAEEFPDIMETDDYNSAI